MSHPFGMPETWNDRISFFGQAIFWVQGLALILSSSKRMDHRIAPLQQCAGLWETTLQLPRDMKNMIVHHSCSDFHGRLLMMQQREIQDTLLWSIPTWAEVWDTPRRALRHQTDIHDLSRSVPVGRAVDPHQSTTRNTHFLGISQWRLRGNTCRSTGMVVHGTLGMTICWFNV